jgi:hypothetical protein
MPKDFEVWIADFNKQKGWVPIVVPRGEKGARRSPQGEMQKLIEQSSATEAKLAKELGEMNATVTDLVRKVRDEHRDLEKFRLENDLKIAQKKRASLEAKHLNAQQLKRQRERVVAQMEEMEGAVKTSILDLHGDILTITTNPARSVRQGHPSRLTYDHRNQEVMDKINKVRATTINLRDPALKGAQKYNGISTPEYTLLQMMLQKADAYADTGDIAAANQVLDETLKKLDEISKSRRGVVLAKISPDRNPEISGFVSQILQSLSAIRSAGLDTLPESLVEELNREDRKFEIAKASRLNIKTEDLVIGHKNLAERCSSIAGQIGAYKAASTETERLFGEVNLLNAQEAAADQFMSLMNHQQVADITVETNWLLDLNAALEKVIARERNALLSQENINPADLRNKLDSIKQNVETMFKHHKNGSRVTDKDAKSQDDKDIQKDKKIKREALDEIAMRLKMADLLLESNSVDAMKRAAAYLEELEAFETDVKDNSKHYETTEDGIKKIKDIFTKLQNKYRDYLLDERSELKIALDAFEKDYKKQAPKTNATKLEELLTKANGFLDRAVDLKKLRNQFNDMAKRLAGDPKSDKPGGEFAKVGKLLKKDFENRPAGKLEGYFGQLTKDYAAARAEADKRDEIGLNAGIAAVESITKKIEAQILIVAKMVKAKGDKDKLTIDEYREFGLIWNDAVQGQNAHDAEKIDKEKWDKAHPILKDRLKKLRSDFKDLKLDLTEIDLAILDLDSVATKQKSTPDYAAAMKEHDRIKQAADELEKVANELKTFKAAPLDEAANLVCDQVELFVKFVNGFEDTIKNADPKADEKYDLSNLRTFLALVKEAVPDAAIKGLRSTTKLLAKNTSLSPEGRELRETALGHVRLINGRLRASAPIKHFRAQTFASDATLDTALAALDRLQIKLLTALK